MFIRARTSASSAQARSYVYVARYARRINKSRSCHAVCRETRCLESAPRVLPPVYAYALSHTHARTHARRERVRIHDLVLRLGGHVFFRAQVLPRFAGILVARIRSLLLVAASLRFATSSAN